MSVDNIYREQLSSHYHGLALWDPKPVENLHKQPGHVSIGDVGYLDNGAFIRMFNVTLPWDDPSNKLLGKPEKYECIEPSCFGNVRDNEIREGEYYTPHVSKVDNIGADTHEDAMGQMYQCRAQHHGAFLSLPHKGHRKDVLPIKVFEKYIRDNVDSWFRWSKKMNLAVEQMEDIILVTGCTLVTSWAAAAFDGRTSVDSDAATISLEARKSDGGGAQFFWRNIRGIVEYQNSRFDPNVQEPLPQNQCVFIRGFRAKRIFFRTIPMRAAAEPLPDDPDDRREDEIQVTRIPDSSKYRDPLVGILDYIIQKCNEDISAAEDIIAIAHDDDLRLIEGVGTLTADAIENFLHEKQMPLIVENGSAILCDPADNKTSMLSPESSLRLCSEDLTNMDLSSGHLSRSLNRFRVLIMGRRNAGKTTILEKMTGSDVGAKPEIRDKEGRLVAGLERGMSVIDYEITYPSSPRFVFHDSRGIEAGAEGHDSSKLGIEYIQKFIDDRAQQTRIEDHLHAIWFCMPMDTPRVPSDEFELAFLEKVNHNVPVIAVLTKYEALVDRVKGEYKGRQVPKSDILNYARMNVFNPLKNAKHSPAAIVQTHHKGSGCELLVTKTFEALNDEALASIFAMAQQNSMKLACQLTFKQNLASISSKLKMATKMNKRAALHKLVDKSLKFLPFWNLINSNDDDAQYRFEITSAIENWLKPNSMDIFIDYFYVKFVALVCLIGCLSLQHSKTPWKHVTKAIEKLDNEEIRAHFIKDLEALYQKHKYDSEEFYLKLSDLVVGNASMY